MTKRKCDKLLLLTIGNMDHASSRVRALQYLPLLEKESGFQVTWIPRISSKANNIYSKYFRNPIAKRWYTLKRFLAILFGSYKVIFIQKMFISTFLSKVISFRGIRVIYDFDDAIYLPTEQSGVRNEVNTIRMIKLADYVFVSSDYLIPFCKKNDVDPILITSAVDSDRIKPKEEVEGSENRPLRIGWIGSPWTSKFLKEITEPLKNIASTFDFELFLVGVEDNFEIDGLKIVKNKWSLQSEATLLRQMDIGIMPLPKTNYAKGKGGFKLYQYMSAGLPVVASPVGINKSIVLHGENGFLADNESQWEEFLSTLIEDKNLRIQLGQMSRELLEAKYSLKFCYKKMNDYLGALK